MQFLRTIWGDFSSGYRCVVSGKMRHNFYPSFEAVKYPTNTDVWFAPAIFSVEERKIPNVIAVKAFWLDIDCGKPGAYSDQVEAITALREFVDHYSLPEPAVINSGNGIHVYWILDKHITPEQWHPIAGALREACVEQNLLADHGITIDIARILRVPGTKNYKDRTNPKSVEILTSGAVCTLSDLDESIGDLIFRAEIKKNAKNTNAVFAVDLPQTPKDANRIADQCAQLRAFRDTKGNLPEPTWYAGLGLLSLCVDAEAVAQDWSSGHPSYDPGATTAKLERAAEFAPTTCAKFAEVNPDGCAGCIFSGKITSPIQLGETVTPLAPRTVDPTAGISDALGIEEQRTSVAQDDNDIVLPKGYLVGEEGVYLAITLEDGTVEKKVIFTRPVWVSQVAKAEVGGGSEVELSWIDANNKLCRASFKQSLLAIDANIATWLLDQEISDYGNIKTVIQYLRAAISAYKVQRGTTIVFDRFGMHESGFVVGSDLITSSGRERARVSQRLDTKRVNRMSVRGELSEWTKASRLLDEEHFAPHRFTVLGALSSPLYALTENDGSVLSLAGESAGGKTTSANFGLSAYGHPDALTVDPNSTVNAFFEHWRQVGNLPLVVNEAATIRRDRLGEIIYAAANGKARDTSTRDQRIIDKGGWRTLTIFTSNLHLLDMPETVVATAQRNRILELSFTTENKMPIHIGKALSEAARRHHGEAGRILIQTYLQHRDELTVRIAERVKEVSKGIHPDYRYGIWQIAANDIAGQIARALNLIEFEIEDCIDLALENLRERSNNTVDPMTKLRQVLDEYTNRYQESIGQREANNSKGWYKEPRGEARGKWKMSGGKPVELCIATNLFGAFCLENGVDANHIKQWTKLKGIKSKAERLAESANPVWCYLIPASEVSDDDADA